MLVLFVKRDNKIKKATNLRRRGFSFREISERLDIAKSTASMWLKNVEISQSGQKRILKLGINGRKRGLAKIQNIRERANKLIHKRTKELFAKFEHYNNDQFFLKVICSILYWCEGGKLDKSRVSFINSDPEMVNYFLKVFRRAFNINENKFRALVHLHSYHNPDIQNKFWSKITGIRLTQFSKSFLKANSGKNKRENYPGCVSIRYYDSKIKKELIDIYKTLVKKTAGVG